MDIWKVFQTITLTHPTNFALVNIALNKLPGGPDGPDPPDGAGAGVSVGGEVRTSPSRRLACGSFLCIICLYWRRFGVGDGGYLPLTAGASAGGHLG